MIVNERLRTVDLARAGGISVQQVRNYEAKGFIPPSERSTARYRLYTGRHLAALRTMRSLLNGYGWQRAGRIMQALHGGNLAGALALIDARHAELAGTRSQIEQTLAALRTLTAQPPAVATRAAARPGQSLRVGDAAKQVGVRVSALRFWEEQGLLHPVRDKESRYRLYDDGQMRRLRVVALLRESGTGFDAIRLVLDALAAGRTEKAIEGVEKRQAEIARVSLVCVAGMAMFHAYTTQFYPDLLASL